MQASENIHVLYNCYKTIMDTLGHIATQNNMKHAQIYHWRILCPVSYTHLKICHSTGVTSLNLLLQLHNTGALKDDRHQTAGVRYWSVYEAFTQIFPVVDLTCLPSTQDYITLYIVKKPKSLWIVSLLHMISQKYNVNLSTNIV